VVGDFKEAQSAKIGQRISGIWAGPERSECDLGTGGERKVSWLERIDHGTIDGAYPANGVKNLAFRQLRWHTIDVVIVVCCPAVRAGAERLVGGRGVGHSISMLREKLRRR
jgi:hypothetical protein